MAIKKIQATTILADQLAEWSELREVSKDPYLSQLISSLYSRKNLHIWSEINPMDYLPHPHANYRLKQKALIRMATLLRNVLVFAPVALTWAAVGAATSGFERYVAKNGANVVNFLDFWQNGYGELAAHWRISEIARLDFYIIIAVIALTIYVSFASHKSGQIRLNEELQLDLERSAIALQIHTVLFDKRKITTVTMNQALAGSISRLVNATHSLESAAKAINKAQRA